MDGVGVWHQLVKHLRAVGQLFVVFALLIEQTYRLAIAAACITELFSLPVEVAQLEQKHSLLNTTAGGTLVTLFVGADGAQCVFLSEIDVADGIVDLIEIVLVIIRPCHALQPPYHLPRLPRGHHLGHGDARIELHLIGRIEPHHMAVSLEGQLPVARLLIELAQQIPLAGALLPTHLVLDDLA